VFQQYQDVLLSGDRVKFDEFVNSNGGFMKYFHIVVKEKDFLVKFFSLDLAFFTHVISSIQNFGCNIDIDNYIQNNNMIAHANILYDRHKHKAKNVTQASLICLEKNIERTPDSFELLEDFVFLIVLRFRSTDLTAFYSALRKMKHVKYDYYSFHCQAVFCDLELAIVLKEIMVFPEYNLKYSYRIDVRYLLLKTNLFTHFEKLIDVVNSMVRVHYERNLFINFEFSSEVMDYLVEKFHLNAYDILLTIETEPTREKITYFYKNGNRCGYFFHLNYEFTLDTYQALREFNVQLKYKNVLCLPYEYTDEEQKITVIECEKIDFNHVTMIKFWMNIPKDVFVWLTQNQSYILGEWMSSPIFLFRFFKNPKSDISQLEWLFSWTKKQNQILRLNEVINFYDDTPPHINCIAVMRRCSDVLDFNDISFTSMRNDIFDQFWKVLFSGLPQLVESYHKSGLHHGSLDRYLQ